MKLAEAPNMQAMANPAGAASRLTASSSAIGKLSTAAALLVTISDSSAVPTNTLASARLRLVPPAICIQAASCRFSPVSTKAVPMLLQAGADKEVKGKMRIVHWGYEVLEVR